MKKPQFVTDYFYHIYSRGVEKRKIFLDKDDHFRFIHDLYEFNDKASALNLRYKLSSLKLHEVEPREVFRLKRELLVEILAFCLMPNHFHLLVRQCRDGGIVRFMHKLGTGYTMYFNKKYTRVGPLFQGRFKAVFIEKESHFTHLPHYIHLNPLDLTTADWRNKRIHNLGMALKELDEYRWSSYLDHTGTKNLPSVISSNLFKEFYGSPAEYKKSLKEWLTDMDMNDLAHVTIEDPHNDETSRGSRGSTS